MQYLKSGSLFAEKDEEGRFVYIGTKPDHAPLPAYCREQPFAIDYAINERGEEIYGAGENFSLRESSEKISVYTSQDERAEVKVLQKIYRGVLSQKVTLTNRSGGELCNLPHYVQRLVLLVEKMRQELFTFYVFSHLHSPPLND